MTRSGSYAESEKYTGLYFHDDWRATRRLTVNLGIRYEYESPMTERFDRGVTTFAFNQANPVQAQAAANYARSPIPELPPDRFRALGGLLFAGVDGNSRQFWQGDRGNWMPRAGFAYQLNARTVVRGGYGVFFNTIGVARQPSIQSGFSQTTPIQATLDNGLTYQATLANPFPTGLIPPAGAAGGLKTFLGQSISVFAPERKHPYIQRWTLNMQRQLPAEFLVEAAYVGSRGTHLGVNRDINATPGQYLGTLGVRDPAVINSLGATFPNPFYGTDPIFPLTINRASLLRPYPEFGSITMMDQPIGYSWYHSLQTRVEKRFSHGYTMNLAYTWSKSMDATQLLNATDPRPFETISSLDRAHRVVASWIWDLPFGRGRSYGKNLPSALNFVAGGWSLNGMYQHQSGAPIEWGDVWTLFTGDSTQVGLANDNRSVDHWFNTTGFNRNGAQQLASNIRVSPFRFSNLRANGQARWDFVVYKDFPVWERLNVQVKAECDNAFNHPNLFAPNTGVTSSLFGQITSQDVPRVFQLNLNIHF